VNILLGMDGAIHTHPIRLHGVDTDRVTYGK